MVSGIAQREVETPSGPARVHTSLPGTRTGTGTRTRHGLAVLGHGAGGGVETPDLLAVTASLTDAGWEVARVEQPYRVKGRRAPEAAPRLDAAWIAVLGALRGGSGEPLLVGGRSSGARVACRTAGVVAADAVLALSFPLHPPGRPEKSRAEELAAVEVPVLVVQGARDPFGDAAELAAALGLAPAPYRSIVSVPGDHSLRRAADVVAAEVVGWLAGMAL